MERGQADGVALGASLDAEDRQKLMDDMQEVSAALVRMARETSPGTCVMPWSTWYDV